MASLSSVRIPSDALPVLERIAALSSDQYQRLVETLSRPGIRSVAGLQQAVSEATSDVWPREDEVEGFVNHLMSMSSLGASHDFSPTDLAATVVKRVADDIEESAQTKLAERLAELLSAPNFFGFSKAVDVSTEYDQVVHLTRFVTDVRPVFELDPSSDPLGTVITHNLRIDYFSEGRIKTTSFALNGNDLSQLKEAVDRAQKKQETLSRVLERAGLTEFDVTGDADE